MTAFLTDTLERPHAVADDSEFAGSLGFTSLIVTRFCLVFLFLVLVESSREPERLFRLEESAQLGRVGFMEECHFGVSGQIFNLNESHALAASLGERLAPAGDQHGRPDFGTGIKILQGFQIHVANAFPLLGERLERMGGEVESEGFLFVLQLDVVREFLESGVRAVNTHAGQLFHGNLKLRRQGEQRC